MSYKGTLEEVIKQFCEEKWGMSPNETMEVASSIGLDIVRLASTGEAYVA